MRFEWDSKKERSNRDKHGVGFDVVRELFESGVVYLDIFDEDHCDDEERFISIGPIAAGVVAVISAESIEDTIRIISARPATPAERELYFRFVEER